MTASSAGRTGQGGEVWEPWTPEIGQRVRIRVSPECPVVHLSRLDDVLRGHHTDYTGEIGVVEGISRYDPNDHEAVSAGDTNDGHDFYVSDHDLYPDGRWHRVSAFFAAIELEPVFDPPAPEHRAEGGGQG
jgi:hypothetical protein